MYDIYTFLNDFLFESLRFIFLGVVMILGIFCGKALRNHKDLKKVSKDDETK